MKLVGHSTAVSKFLHAKEQGKLHHAWLIQGPSGIGKRFLADYFTGHLLGSDEATLAQIQAGGHKDLCVLTRDTVAKKRDIQIEAVRDLRGFFQMRSALDGWRVGIIDSTDELNLNGVNALLKTLEEPPERCILFLISHGRKALLPTITSRCQTLNLCTLTPEQTAQILSENGYSPELASIAPGRPGLAMKLSDGDAQTAHQMTTALLSSNMRKPDPKAELIRLVGKSESAFEGFVLSVLSHLAKQATHKPELADQWLKISRLHAAAIEDSLDLTQTCANIFSILQPSKK